MEQRPAAAGAGAVVLDIGGDFGAAVITTEAGHDGRELEIRPAGAPWSGRHVGFHVRRTETGPLTAAVFSGLPAGEWEVRMMGTHGNGAPISVCGGAVTTVRLHPTDLSDTGGDPRSGRGSGI